MKKLTLLLLISLLPICSQAQSINTELSSVSFKISNMVFNSVKGTFSGMTGDINFNEDDLENSSFNVCIKAATVNTGNDARDTHLKKEDYFDIEKHPSICFSSTSISKTTEGYLTKGSLTINGITKKVEIPFTYSDKTLKGELNVNRTDFKIGGSGGFLIGQTAKLEIKCVLD